MSKSSSGVAGLGVLGVGSLVGSKSSWGVVAGLGAVVILVGSLGGDPRLGGVAGLGVIVGLSVGLEVELVVGGESNSNSNSNSGVAGLGVIVGLGVELLVVGVDSGLRVVVGPSVGSPVGFLVGTIAAGAVPPRMLGAWLGRMLGSREEEGC